jgi:hypothetical protein
METLSWTKGVQTPPPCLKWLNGLKSRTSGVGAARQPVPSLNVSQRRLSTTEGRSLRHSCASPSLPSLTSWAGEDNRSRRELTRVEAKALERHPPRTTPLPTLLLLRTWRSTWEKLTGRPSVSVENASVDEVVREPRVAPISSRQPLLQSRDVLPEPHVVTGKFSFPVTTTDLTFLYLVSREKLKWTTDGLPSTEPDLHATINPLYKPPCAVRLGGTPESSLNVLCTTVGHVSVRYPPLNVAPALTTLSFWASSPPLLNSSRSGSYISNKGIRISRSWSNCL